MALASLVFFTHADAAKTYKMTTVVEDFVTTKWEFKCPPNRKVDLAQASMTLKGWQEFLECLATIESDNGIALTSKTVVRNKVTESDKITSKVEMTAEQATKLCGIIDANPLPPSPPVASRPRIQELAVDSVIDNIVLDLGDGCVLDLTRTDLDPRVIGQLFDLLDNFAQQNGTQVSSTSKSKLGGGTDRIHTITYLTPDQVEALKQLLFQNEVLLPPGFKWVPVSMKLLIDVGGQKVRVKGEGRALMVWSDPPRPAPPGHFPRDIIELEMIGNSPLGEVRIGLLPDQIGPGVQIQDPNRPFKLQTELELPLEFQLPGQPPVQLEQPVTVFGKSKAGSKRGTRLKAKGKFQLVDDDGPVGSVKILKLVFGSREHAFAETNQRRR